MERATEEQVREILTLLEQGLDEGAIGIGFALGYMPGTAPEEVLAVSKLAARRAVPIFVHMRNDAGAVAATEEVIANAVTTGAHWHIAHVYLDSKEGLELVALAQKAGVSITPETLGWLSGSTYIAAAFLRPEALRKAGRKSQDILYYGQRVSSFEELAHLQQTDPKAHIITVQPDDDETNVARRNEIARRLMAPGWVFASDTMPWTQRPTGYIPEKTWPLPPTAWAHPRGAANYTRIIQRYVREWRLVSLMDVLRAGSLNPAQELETAVPQFRNKGRLKVGADADLIVFDPQRVEAVATIEKPARLSRGMDYVIVNGTVLIDGGKLDAAAFPGQPIRRNDPH
jgi:N-acyl-D-glutamate deacylase